MLQILYTNWPCQDLCLWMKIHPERGMAWVTWPNFEIWGVVYIFWRHKAMYFKSVAKLTIYNACMWIEKLPPVSHDWSCNVAWPILKLCGSFLLLERVKLSTSYLVHRRISQAEVSRSYAYPVKRVSAAKSL